MHETEEDLWVGWQSDQTSFGLRGPLWRDQLIIYVLSIVFKIGSLQRPAC